VWPSDFVGPALSPIGRRRAAPAFAPRPISALEPVIRELCIRLLDNVAGQDVVNAGSEYAQFIPPAVISRMLGFPEADDDLFRRVPFTCRPRRCRRAGPREAH
jgi:cytochrome P450